MSPPAASAQTTGARVLAPGVVSTGGDADELQPAISPDGRTLYFGRRVPDGPFTLFAVEQPENGVWGRGRALPFSARSCEVPVLTYLANEAVFLEGAEGSVLIDAPFTTGVEPYPRLEPRTLERIRAAEAPFDVVDWILITHEHADHGDAEAIADHLVANPRARLASTPAVIEAVRTAIARRQRSLEIPAGIAGRLLAAGPKVGRVEIVHADAPRIEAVALHHGLDPGSVANLGWLVEMGDVRILHVGDSEVVASEVSDLPSLPGLDIDVALLPTWYLSSPMYRSLLRHLEAERLLLMHFAKPGSGDRLYQRIGGRGALLRRATEHRPPVEPLLERGTVLCLGTDHIRGE